ncbi:cytochrome b/b6 domain-containing protein [Neptunomonas concharum]|nr:cytochrome b/b6 domain-containing protein [Neptunomonas concharum]
MSDKPTNSALQAVTVWDISVRIFHWSLVAGIGFLWYSGEEGGNIMTWHMYVGYTMLGLILYRLLWGIYGSTYARFSYFIKSPGKTFNYAKDFLKGESPHYLSHNPLGGWMAIVLMSLVFIQAATGLFATDDIITEGPLFSLVDESTAYLLTEIHEINFNLLLLCAGLHIAAVLYHRFVKGEDLVKSMITGKKNVALTPSAGLKFSWYKMLLTAGLVGASIYGLVNMT